MTLDWGQVLTAVATFGTALGTSLGIAVGNSLRRKTIDRAVEHATTPLAATDEGQEVRIQRLEQQVFGWKPRKKEP